MKGSIPCTSQHASDTSSTGKTVNLRQNNRADALEEAKAKGC